MVGSRPNSQGSASPHEALAELAGAGAALAAAETESDRIFRTIFDHVAVGIWQSTPDGRYVRVNPRCAQIMGYDTPAEAVAAVSDIAQQIYVDPAERDLFKSKLAAEGRVSGFVARHRKRDGSVYWVRLSAVAVPGPDGKPAFYIGSGEEVSELIEMQEQLRAAERDYREMWENAAEGIYRSSPEGRQLRANPALVAFNGYGSEAELLAAVGDIAKEWYVEPGRREDFKRLLRENGRIHNFESEVYRHKSRERVWISENAWEVRDAEGKLLYYEGTIRDITASRKAEQRIRESEERFRDYADTASDWYWETGPDHRLTFVSEGVGMLRGRNRAFALGRTRWEMSADAESEPEKWAEFRALLERHEWFGDFKYRIATPDGQVQVVAINGKPKFAPDGAFLGYRGSGRLITEQVRQSEALLESQARFRDFAATASDWFWETDEAHRFTYFSSSARFGLGSPVDGLGKTRWDIGLDVAEEPEKWRRHRAQLDRRETFRDFVYLARMANGETHYSATSGMPIFGPDGKFRGYRGSSRLVTDAIRQEERLKEAKAQAEAASATKSAFLANMSHELRTPLNAIIGFSEIMNREMFGKIGVARYADYIKDIGDSAQHLLRLIEDILDLSKAEAGKMELEEAEIDLAASVHSACLMLRERAKRGGVALVEEVSVDLPRLYGDRRRIRQVLLNLVSNAVKFTPSGGTVRVSVASGADGGLVISVADTGIGMEADDIPRVFEPFVQLGRDKGISGEGTGLGLPLCKELVELHGGTMSLVSQPGAGTMVAAAFPPGRTVPRRAAA
ncbi:MAG: PAS domain-containing sensor histidine kinase [Alphaproteobacteria bacterium]